MSHRILNAALCSRVSTQIIPYFQCVIRGTKTTYDNGQKICRRYISKSITQKQFSSKKLLPFEVDTNVAKDVILYQYNNTRFQRLISFFAVGQFFFWICMAHFSYTFLRDAPVKSDENKDELPFWRKVNIGQNKYRYGLTLMCASIGYFIVVAASFWSYRSVHSLILRQGGEKLEIITYKPFALRRKLEVPVNNTSCFHSRNDATSYLSLKIKGYRMFFLLDKNGTFANRELFDYTAGMKRLLK